MDRLFFCLCRWSLIARYYLQVTCSLERLGIILLARFTFLFFFHVVHREQLLALWL